MAEAITQVLGVVGMKTRGEYNPETTYEKLNVVTYNGSSYCAKTDTQGNLPTNTLYWDLIAEKGEKGDAPEKGVDYWTTSDKSEIEADLSSDVTSEVTTQLGGLTSATPLVASSVSGMTDTSRIYVNTSDGYWYWYNDTEWVRGGQYLSDVITNLYTDLLFITNNSFSFDTTNSQLTIGACRFVFKQQYYNIETNQTINIPTSGTASKFVYFDTTDNTFKCSNFSQSQISSTKAIVLLFNNNALVNPNCVSYKGKYVVDGVNYNVINNIDYINNIINFISLTNKPLFTFNTTNKTLKIDDCRVFNNKTGTTRDIASTTLDYSNVSGTTYTLAYDFNNNSYVIGTNNLYANNSRYGIMMVWNNNLKDNNMTTYKDKIIVNGKETLKYIEEVTIYLDDENGDDNNDGTVNFPFKTLEKALSVKPTTLIIKKGEYEGLSSNINWDIKIKSWYSQYNNESNPKYKKPIIYFGKKLAPTLDNVSGLLKTAYDSTSDSTIYKVFVSKEMPIQTSSSRPSYYVTLWVSDVDDERNDIKLTPVLSLANCQNTNNSFYYDGIDIYINDGTSFTNKRYILSINDLVSTGLSFNTNNVTLDNISFRYAWGRNIQTSLNSLITCNLIARNCDFGNSSASDGISLDYSNSNLYNCNAYKNRNDGFNIHSFGTSHFYNCNGYYNEDDGISHHDGTTGYIEGGEWYNNGKGGISSPTYGSLINITGAYSHDNNQYGILVAADNPVNGNILISNCVLKNNTLYDLSNSNYSIIMYNTIYDTKRISGSGSINEY